MSTRELLTTIETADAPRERAVYRPTVHVYEAPVRLWHWVNALCIVTLCVTGYLIASPLPAVGGEASEHFIMGYVRFTHFAAGQLLAVAFLGRIIWAFLGNAHARQLFYVPVFSRKYWSGALFEARWYMFLEKYPKKYVGHNPLANLAMVFMFTLGTVFMIVTGGALYSEGAGIDSAWGKAFGWVFSIWPNSQMIHTWHHFGMWLLVVFTILHVYAAIREDIMSRQSMISAIISGERTFRDDVDD